MQDQLAFLPVIAQEILQGIRIEKEFKVTRDAIYEFPFIDYDGRTMATQAAELYRMLRLKGVTIRKPNDCLIAAICIRHDFVLIHNDKDFDQIAKHTSLKIYKTTS